MVYDRAESSLHRAKDKTLRDHLKGNLPWNSKVVFHEITSYSIYFELIDEPIKPSTKLFKNGIHTKYLTCRYYDRYPI